MKIDINQRLKQIDDWWETTRRWNPEKKYGIFARIKRVFFSTELGECLHDWRLLDMKLFKIEKLVLDLLKEEEDAE